LTCVFNRWSRSLKRIERQQLADGIGITYRALSKADEREPDFAIQLKLADYFNVFTDYLLGCTDDPMTELPGEARKSMKEFIDFVYKKYGKK
jgi:transcriptional regulator with XRE-family HTH domain